MTLFKDAHIHLAALEPSTAFAIANDGEEILSVTCGPAEYLGAKERFAQYPSVHVALGLHPWRINDAFDIGELDVFLDLAQQEHFIGEIGLDFYKEYASSRQQQLNVFHHICETLSHEEHVISFHSRSAAGELLDFLEDYCLPQKSQCILHGYNGPSDQMSRALKMGCYFSLGEREFKTKRGREYARQLPADRLLFETDADGVHPFSFVDWKLAVGRDRY